MMNLYNNQYHNAKAANYMFRAQDSLSNAYYYSTAAITDPKVIGLALYTLIMVSTPMGAPVSILGSAAMSLASSLTAVGTLQGPGLIAAQLFCGVMLAENGAVGIQIIKSGFLGLKEHRALRHF